MVAVNTPSGVSACGSAHLGAQPTILEADLLPFLFPMTLTPPSQAMMSKPESDLPGLLMMVDESERERAKSAFADPTQYLRNNSYITLRAQAVRRMMPATSAKSILDLGCGDGRISIPLVGDADELLLVDASKGMLELAVQHVPAAMVDRV